MAERTTAQSAHPIDEANWLSRLTLYWFNKTLKTGSRRPLGEEDLFPTLEESRMEELTRIIESHWEKELIASQQENRNPRLWKALAGIFSWKEYFTLISLKLSRFVAAMSLPLLLWFFLKDLSSGSESNKTSSLLYVLGISLLTLIQGVSLQHSALISDLWGIRLKVACMGLIYKKILCRLNRCDLQNVLTGKTINLVSNDARRLQGVAFCMMLTCTSPIQVLASLIISCYLIGWQALIGAAFFVILTVFIGRMSQYCAALRDKAAAATDERLEVMNEVVSGIRAVKMYGWEWNFTDVVETVRRKEMHPIRTRGLILSIITAFNFTAVPIAGFLSVTTLILTGVHVAAFKIFTLLSCLGILNYAIAIVMGECLHCITEANVAVERMQRFLGGGCVFPISTSRTTTSYTRTKYSLESACNEPAVIFKGTKLSSIALDSVQTVAGISYMKKTEADSTRPSEDLVLCNISCSWNNQEKETLSDISFTVKRGQMMAVTGPVGSGKSSLLMAIIGELPVTSGSMSYNGSIAYVPQMPWVFSGTVRENIVFGNDFDLRRYKEVIAVCCLQKDLDNFPKGELTQIGQRGVRLSGGQRQRVSLARALYSNADLYLLDDPLSAVDAKVGQHLFESCICGFLSERTRVLVTHQLHYLANLDHVIVLNKGRVTYEGSSHQLQGGDGSYKGLFIDCVRQDDIQPEKTVMRGETSLASVPQSNQLHLEAVTDLKEEEEDRCVGSVTWKTYWKFFNVALPTVLIIFLVAFTVGIKVFLIAPYWWASKIAEMSIKEQKEISTFAIFGAMVLAALLTSTMATYMFFATILRASEKLHNRMVLSIIKAPVLFFDTNSLGRILNRFSKDIGSMDDQLPVLFVYAVEFTLATVVACLIPAVANVWLLLAVVPVVTIVLYLARYYLKSSRELNRLDAITCSPVYAHIAETLSGLEIIRSSRMEETFLRRLYKYQDVNTSALNMVALSRRWFALRTTFLGSILIAATGAGALLVTQSAALAGFSLAYLLDTFEYAHQGIRVRSEVENTMTSVERVMSYTELDQELGYCCETLPPDGWPLHGHVTLQDLDLAYVEGGPRALKDINLTIAAKEKVGVAGRTGAGKSSLVAALFRMPDPGGEVLIDGVQIGALNLQAVRRSMAVITQDPMLFRGSLRKNLDPFYTFTDHQLWTVLEEVQMKRLVETLPGQLDYQLKESGSNFSVGERQLICLARALSQRSKIIIMDEATANVDFKTDRLIQEVIRSKFQDSTVVTIAHRLNTIIDYDKVLVLDGGRVVEFDKPDVLLNRKEGLFAELVRCQTQASKDK